MVHALVEGADAPRAGFVVGRGIGGAVVRNVVRRRLRHLMYAQLGVLPPGARIVVRALPSAAVASQPELAVALTQGLARALPHRAVGAPVTA